LGYAAGREGDLYAQIARLVLEGWGSVDTEAIQQSIDTIHRGEDGSQGDLLGLLGIIYRYADSWTFPEKLEKAIREAALGFTYWYDESSHDVMCYTSEGDSILFHACEILAGQLYAEATFASAGQTGGWHRATGEKRALAWLRERGTKGFVEWDSSVGFKKTILALSHLADLVENDEIRELAAIVLDKLFFTIAVNSYKGVFGSTRGRTSAPMVKSGQLAATAGITRLLWGMGVWNHHIKGLVALACSNYELPTMIASIAVDLDSEMWHQEHHPGVDKVTYRTPDGMLCSAQDYHPGERGDCQHIWQATLGPDAVVFVNQPSWVSEDDAHRANFWRGNALLPRVAQWKDVLVAVHKLDDDGGPALGFTHAYFPVHEFDEYVFVDGWACARKGKGYLALAASRGFELITRGTAAFRELRSFGREQVWLCMIGRAEVDGTFAQFQAKVRALRVEWDALAVRGETLRGETLSFGWEGPLLVDDQAQPLSGFKHYDGPHCVAEWPASQMDINYGDYTLRLSFD
jgi:hypothetical protein